MGFADFVSGNNRSFYPPKGWMEDGGGEEANVEAVERLGHSKRGHSSTICLRGLGHLVMSRRQLRCLLVLSTLPFRLQAR